MEKFKSALICFLIFSFYMFDTGGSYSLVPYALGAILFVLVVFDSSKDQASLFKKNLYFDKTFYLFVSFFIIGFSGVFYAASPSSVINRLILLTFNIMLFFSVLNHLTSMERIKLMVKSFVYSGSALSLYLLINSDLRFRLGGIFGNVNRIGNLLAFAFVIAAYYLFIEKKYSYSFHFVLIGTAVLLTGARQSLIFCITVLIALLIMRFRKGVHNRMRLIVLLFGMAILGYGLLFHVPIIYESLGSRVENLVRQLANGNYDGKSTSVRVEMIRFGLHVFKDHPLLGYGLDNYKFLYEEIYRQTYAHNNYVELLVDTGIAGMLLFYSTFFNIAWISLRGIRLNKLFSEFSLAFILGLLVLGNFSVYYSYKTIYVIFALFIAYDHLSVQNGDRHVSLTERLPQQKSIQD